VQATQPGDEGNNERGESVMNNAGRGWDSLATLTRGVGLLMLVVISQKLSDIIDLLNNLR
jgi:hypothetical protein